MICETKGVNLDRIMNKFRENDYEKIDRLFELHKYYYCLFKEFDIACLKNE